jgi:hypothetical protein
MKPFAYFFEGVTYHSTVEYFKEGADHRYRVQVENNYSIIVPSAFPGPNNAIVWVQSHKGDEIVLAHELVQALGEGVEHSGMQIERVSTSF